MIVLLIKMAVFIAAACLTHAGLLRLLGASELGRTERWAAAATFQVAAWTAMMVLLGFLGVLFAWPLLAVMLLAGAALFVGTRRLAVATCELDSMPIVARSLSPIAWSMLLLAVTAAAHALLLAVLMPVVDYDGMSYHLPLAAHMFQDGDFRYYPGESAYVNHFARGGELLATLTMMVSGTAVLADGAQWLMLPLLWLGVFSAARRLGIDRSHAVIGASLVPLCPVIYWQSRMTYVDLLCNGWFVIALLAVLGGRRGDVGAARMVWFFAAAGLCVGSKMSGAALALVAGLAALVHWGPRAFFGGRRALATTALALAVSAAVGMPWMIRNWVGWGSPIFPFSVDVFEKTLLEGDFPFSAVRDMTSDPDRAGVPELAKLWQTFTEIDLESRREFGWFGGRIPTLPAAQLFDDAIGVRGDQKIGGFGLLWLLAELPALLLVLALSAAGRMGSHRRAVLVLGGALILALYLTASPWWARFSLYLAPLGSLAVALLLDTLGGGHSPQGPPVPRRAARGVALALVLVAALYDWTANVVVNRDFARCAAVAAREGQIPADTVEWFLAIVPENSEWRAIAGMLREARPGETISGFSPFHNVMTGLYQDGALELRVFPFPSFYPSPDLFPPERVLKHLTEEGAALFLASHSVGEEYDAALLAAEWRQIDEWDGFRLFESPARAATPGAEK